MIAHIINAAFLIAFGALIVVLKIGERANIW